MLPSPGWLLFTAFLLVEVAIVLVLVAPMPSNQARGIVLETLLKVWNKQNVRYGCWAAVGLCGLYFYDALQTIATAPTWSYSCEQREMLFFVERNCYACGGCVLLFFVLRRLLDIQQQLHVQRGLAKAASGGSSKLE